MHLRSCSPLPYPEQTCFETSQGFYSGCEQISACMQIGSKTKIIVVDDRGKDAIRIARSLRQFGRAKAYVLEVSLPQPVG